MKRTLSCIEYKSIWAISWFILHWPFPLSIRPKSFWLVASVGTVLLCALGCWALGTYSLGLSCWLTSGCVWQGEALSVMNEGKKRARSGCSFLPSVLLWVVAACFWPPLPTGYAALSYHSSSHWLSAYSFFPYFSSLMLVMASSCCASMAASQYLSAFKVATNNCKISSA